MKQLKDPKKILFYVATAIIIIAGIVMVSLKGFNVELRYRAHDKIELIIGKTVDIAQIQQKANEVFGEGKAVLQIVEEFKDCVQLTAEEITEEQKNSFVEKVNELYPQQAVTEGEEPTKLLDASKITIKSTQNARLRDFLKPYVIPVTISTLAILVYYAIRYRKQGAIKVILKSGLTIVLAQAVLLSILAILRVPMGRLTAPLVLLVYATSIIYTSAKLMRKAEN